MDRPWSSRVWVLQEVALAQRPTIVVGRYLLAWGALAAAEKYIHEYGLFDSSLHRSGGAGSKVQQMDKIRTLRQEAGYVELPRLLTYSQGAFCTDSRDRVYGVLGLIKPHYLESGDLLIDYNLPVSEVLERGVRAMLNHYQTLDLLLLAPLQSHNLPSWYPDLTIHQTGNLWLHQPRMRGIDAAKGSKPSLQFDHSTGRLAARGRIVDTVSDTSVKLQLRPQGDLDTAFFEATRDHTVKTRSRRL